MTVNNRLKRLWKEMITAGFKVLFQHFPGTTKKSHETVSGQLRCRIIFKLRASKIWIIMITTAVLPWFYNPLNYSTAISALKQQWPRVTSSPGSLLSRWITWLFFLPLNAPVCNLTAASFDCTLQHVEVKRLSGHSATFLFCALMLLWHRRAELC
jgi:hypothetical protein